MIEEPYLLILVPWYLFPEGAIAQLGERLLCKQEVVGSIPSGSTRRRFTRRRSGRRRSGRQCRADGAAVPTELVREKTQFERSRLLPQGARVV